MDRKEKEAFRELLDLYKTAREMNIEHMSELEQDDAYRDLNDECHRFEKFIH